MNLFSKKVIKNLLKKYQIRPSRRFGQNFLIDRRAFQRMIKAASLPAEGEAPSPRFTGEARRGRQPNDIVLEIGPGIGNLTRELAKKVKKVIAVEKDPKMIGVLKETLKDFKNVKIIQADILKYQLLREDIPAKYKMVANLPYYIVAPVIRKFLESKYPPKEMILVAQKEVAQRICAQPPKMNLLAVSVQFYGKPEIISYLSKKSFWPQPKVDSAIIKITPKKILPRPDLCNLFFKIVRAGFSQPRKQLINNLSKGLNLDREKIRKILQEIKISPQKRAENLTIKDWLKIYKRLKG